MTDQVSYIEQELRIERYRALEREVTDPLALSLLRDIVQELEADLGASRHTSQPNSAGVSWSALRHKLPVALERLHEHNNTEHSPWRAEGNISIASFIV